MKGLNGMFILFGVVSALFCISSSALAEGEWLQGGNNIFNTNLGKVGIGTTSPARKLHVNESSGDAYISSEVTSDAGDNEAGFITKTPIGEWITGYMIQSSADWTLYQLSTPSGPRVTVKSGGNVGIGTTGPVAQFVVTNQAAIGANNAFIQGSQTADLTVSMGAESSDAHGIVIRDVDDENAPYAIRAIGESGSDIWYVKSNGVPGSAVGTMYMNGNVGIGTTSPQSRLAVNGTINAKEVKVTNTGWSDFVFAENYELPPLKKIESYIKENKHLPDIPSEKEVKEKGLNVSEMLAKQMQKIEELTLYLIELKKENEEVKKELALLKISLPAARRPDIKAE